MKTRERIIQAAVRLFNERGTAAVSTNHIAEAAGISPGNLYYHFRNKEEIIRAIFAHLTAQWEASDALPVVPGDSPLGVADLLRIVRGHFSVLQKYPFYYRELPALVRNDPILAEQYRAMRTHGLTGVETLLRYFALVGVLNLPTEPRALEKLSRICWVLVDFSLPFAELAGADAGPEQTREGEDLVLHVLRPYMTEEALAQLEGRPSAPIFEGAYH